MEKIKNLLQQVSIIQKKYDDLAEYSGEHYNVFDILGVRRDELSHSSILTNLLNAKGKHGQKEIFLDLFLETIINAFKKDVTNVTKVQFLNNFNNFIDFDTKKSTAEKEKFAGKVNYEAEQGGRIDIIINDGKNNIIIENKVDAGDQPLQLVRYYEYDKQAPIFYLTLDGKLPNGNSAKGLTLGKEFICISYQNEITLWLEQCIKEMTNKPIVRETLNQYLFLIKSLTNQSNNNKMSEEIIKIMKLNIESSFEISNNLNGLRKSLFSSFIEKLLNKFSAEIEIKVDSELWRKDKSIQIKNKNWGNLNIEIYFVGDNYTNVHIGLIPSLRGSKLNEQFQNKILNFLSNLNFGKIVNNKGWYFYHSYNVFANTNKAEFWENLIEDEFVNKVFEDVDFLLKNINEVYKNYPDKF